VAEELVDAHRDRVAALAQAAVERMVEVFRGLLPEVLDLAAEMRTARVSAPPRLP
jgi:hypothetical protein